MKQLLILIAMITLMSCAFVPDHQERSFGEKKPKRSELIRRCVVELSDDNGLEEATKACLKIYSRKEFIIE